MDPRMAELVAVAKLCRPLDRQRDDEVKVSMDVLPRVLIPEHKEEPVNVIVPVGLVEPVASVVANPVASVAEHKAIPDANVPDLEVSSPVGMEEKEREVKVPDNDDWKARYAAPDRVHRDDARKRHKKGTIEAKAAHLQGRVNAYKNTVKEMAQKIEHLESLVAANVRRRAHAKGDEPDSSPISRANFEDYNCVYDEDFDVRKLIAGVKVMMRSDSSGTPDDPDNLELCIDYVTKRLNVHFAYVCDGKEFILCRLADKRDLKTNRRTGPDYNNLMPATMKSLLAAAKFTFKVIVDEKLKSRTITAFSMWNDCIDRTTYTSISFGPPEKTKKNSFNMYTGPGISEDDVYDVYPDTHAGYASALRDAQPWIDHGKTIFCHDDESEWNYLFNYCASLIQKPFDRMQVALGIRGEVGSGKDEFLVPIAEIMGPSYKEMHDMRAVTGEFNFILADALVCFFNEADCGGLDRGSIGKLKAMITQKTQVINEKFVSKKTLDVFYNIIIVTNELNVCPAKANARRYKVFETLSTYAGAANPVNEAYHAKVRGCPVVAIARILYARNIDDWNPRLNLMNNALRGQIEMNYDSRERFWLKCLNDGMIGTYPWPADDEAPLEIPRSDFVDAFSSHETTGKEKMLWAAMKTFCVDIDVVWIRGKGLRRRAIFPPLNVCKDAFAKYQGIPDLFD